MQDRETEAFNLVLNEARLLSVEADLFRRRAVFSFVPLRPGPAASEPVQCVLEPVGRIVGSLRAGRWDDRNAPTLPLTLEDLPALVASSQQPIYSDLANQPLAEERHWLGRLSFEHTLSTSEGMTNHLALFQNPGTRHLDVMVWFDRATFCEVSGEEVSLNALAIEVADWWSEMRAGSISAGTEGIRLLAPRVSVWRRMLARLRR